MTRRTFTAIPLPGPVSLRPGDSLSVEVTVNFDGTFRHDSVVVSHKMPPVEAACDLCGRPPDQCPRCCSGAARMRGVSPA